VRIQGMKDFNDRAVEQMHQVKNAISKLKYENKRLVLENDSLMTDNKRFFSEVETVSSENVVLRTDNYELQARNDVLIAELSQLRKHIAINRTDLLFLKLQLRGLEIRSQTGRNPIEQQRLMEDIHEWKRRWRQKTMNPTRSNGTESIASVRSEPAMIRDYVSSTGDDSTSLTSSSGRHALRITRAYPAFSTSSYHPKRNTAPRVVPDIPELEAPATHIDGNVSPNEYGQSSTGNHHSTVADMTLSDVVQEATNSYALGKVEAPQSAWDQLWDDLARLAGVRDIDS